MKKICFLIGNIDHSGGTERVTNLIANDLSKKGYKIYILSLFSDENPFFKLDENIGVYSLYSKKISFKKNLLQTIWKIRSFSTEHELDTLIVVDSISCVFTIPALFGLKIKHICWEHFNFNVDLGLSFRRLGRKLAAKYCDYIVTLTNRDKKLWMHGLSNIKAEIVPIPNPTPYENTENLPNLESKIILAVGRLTHQKGFDFLIDAWAKVCNTNSDWMLRIIGDGEDEKKLKQQAKNLGIYNRIEFIAATKNINKYYETASFYCMSSRFEGLPMVLLEAQAFGLPIVAFDCDTGPSEIITNNINGYLCNQNNCEDLSSALNNMMNISDEKFKNMCLNAKLNSNSFKLDKIIEKWTNII